MIFIKLVNYLYRSTVCGAELIRLFVIFNKPWSVHQVLSCVLLPNTLSVSISKQYRRLLIDQDSVKLESGWSSLRLADTRGRCKIEENRMIERSLTVSLKKKIFHKPSVHHNVKDFPERRIFII